MPEGLSGSVVKLVSGDGVEIVVAKEIACQSITIKNMLDDLGSEQGSLPIPLHNVSGKILAKVVEWCKYHYEHPIPPETEDKKNERRTDDISSWDRTFCEVEQDLLFELIMAANFLEINPLLDLASKTVANMIKGKTPEEIRKTFGIKNDFTPEEEEQVRKENEWCEEH
ncbi:SCF ubiquitin ligase complex protein SKP1b-like [Schistocerca gregaria]|uniref:SCF ubiquitin ligase complex protein SKP1b-like n=1 Tax=Schistocerca gregaria TaxID=7010 RepID=UPI00211EBC40|nr:SCF ubiquitin ligase complex protein SKP1b-like [Schistocerca gregaria]